MKKVMPMHTENRKVFKVQYKMGKRPSDQKKNGLFITGQRERKDFSSKGEKNSIVHLHSTG